MEDQRYLYARKLENGIEVECYIHDLARFRYNWHDRMYELNIVLQGQAIYYVDGKENILEKDDIVLINPHDAHASHSTIPGSVALVIHFSAKAFRPFLEKGLCYHFDFCSGPENRDSTACQCLRFFAASLIKSAEAGNHLLFTCSYQSIIGILQGMFSKSIQNITTSLASKEENEKVVKKVLDYFDSNYAQKITLEQVSAAFGYNRTYFSTLFKKTLGIGFYEYLTRVRFTHAIVDLIHTPKTLTQIALDNGFPDLNTFNRLFKKNFTLTPAEYREMPPIPTPLHGYRSFRSYREKEITEILEGYHRAIWS